MRQRQSILGKLSLCGLLAISTQAHAQSYVATKVFDASSTEFYGVMGLGACISGCLTVETYITPLAINDNGVAFAHSFENSFGSHYSITHKYNLVWDNGLKVTSDYLLYPSNSFYPAIDAGNAGAITNRPTGDYVEPANDTKVNALSNSGRILASAYSGQTLYISTAGDLQWTALHSTNGANLTGNALNNQGVAVGYMSDALNHTLAFYSGNNGNGLKYVDTKGAASSSQLTAINDVDVAVGIMRMNDSADHVFTIDTRSGALQDIGSDLGTSDEDKLTINDAGQVIRGGYIYDPLSHTWARPNVEGFDTPWSLIDINNKGQILASSSLGTYILQPVPEPNPLLMAAFGLGAILLLRKRKKKAAARH